MVQIPEYTRRDTFEATGRPSANLQLPDAIASSQGKNIFGLSIDNLRTVAKGAGEVAKEMVEMKNDYDNAKADEYIVDYMRSADAEIQKYQTERKGDLANGLIEDFEKFSENAFDTATNVNQETQRALLENKEQRDIARRKMDNINLNYFRSISAYQAKEIEAYKQNKATAVVSSYLEKATTESDPVNIQNLLFDARKKIETLYPGQSEEYVNLKFKQLTSGVLAQNVVQESITSPDIAVWKMTTPVFKDNMDPKDYAETKDAVLKSVKSFYSDKISDVVKDGIGRDENLDILLTSSFFKGMDVDAFRDEIMDEAGKKSKEKIEKERTNSINMQNQVVVNAYGREFTAEETSIILGTEKGAEALDTINFIRQNEANEIWNMEQGELPVEPTSDDMLNYASMNRRIKDGYYRTIGDLRDDVSNLPPYMQYEILGSFVDELKYKNDVNRLKKDKGIDLEKELKSQFYYLTRLSAEKNENVFNSFRNGVTNSIISSEKTGEKIDIDSIKKASSQYINSVFNENDDANVVRKIQFDLGTYLRDTPKATLTDIKTQVHKLFNATDLDNVLSKKQQERIEDMIVNGDIDGAVYMMTYYRDLLSNMPERERRKALGKPSLSPLEFVLETGGGIASPAYILREKQ